MKGLTLFVLIGIVSFGLFGFYQNADAASTDYLYEFGTPGTGDGQLSAPVQASFNSNGMIYVIENDNYRVSVFDSDGVFQFKFGSFGSADGQFKHPVGIAVGPSDNVYVVDKNNYRIQVFDSAGNYLRQFGSFGSADGQLNLPHGLAIDEFENIYVADYNNHRIQKFDSDGNHLLSFGNGPGQADGSFKFPTTVAISDDGDVYVTDTRNHRVQVFDSDGVFQFKFGSFGTADGKFTLEVRGIGINNDNVFVGDLRAHKYQVFDLSGNFIKSFGSFGTGDGQFQFVVASPGFDNEGNIYIADSNNHRIQVFGTADSIPPTVTVSSKTAEATSSDGASVSFVATATDDTDGSITPICDHASGDTFGLGDTPVTCTATDAAGNEGTGIGTITVQDTTAPTVTTSEDVTTVATSFDGASVTYSDATATDAVGITSGPTCDVASGSLLSVGDTIVTCTAEDAAGNVGDSSFVITVNSAALHDQKTFAVNALNAINPADIVDKKTPKEIKDAVKHITKSQNDKNWETGDTLTKKGKKVFDEEKKAVKSLLKILKKDKEIDSVNSAISGVIDELVRIDYELANNALAEAQLTMGDKSEKDIAKASKELAKADDELAQGNPDKAIDKLKKVWAHSQHAMKHDVD